MCLLNIEALFTCDTRYSDTLLASTRGDTAISTNTLFWGKKGTDANKQFINKKWLINFVVDVFS